jgi:hypothetical protein
MRIDIRMRAAGRAFAILLLMQPNFALGGAGGEGGDAPLANVPSIFVQNRALGQATVTLTAADGVRCGTYKIASGEGKIIPLCGNGSVKLLMYDFSTESWQDWSVVANRRYETFAQGEKKWGFKDVTAELTR